MCVGIVHPGSTRAGQAIQHVVLHMNCWRWTEPVDTHVLRETASHTLAYPWEPPQDATLAAWGNTTIFLGLEGRTNSRLGQRQLRLQRFVRALGRSSSFVYGLHVDLGDASVPSWALRIDGVPPQPRGAEDDAAVLLGEPGPPDNVRYVVGVNMEAECQRCYGLPLGPAPVFTDALRRGLLDEALRHDGGRAGAGATLPLLLVAPLKFRREPARLTLLADLAYGWRYYGKPEWVAWAHVKPGVHNATANATHSGGIGGGAPSQAATAGAKAAGSAATLPRGPLVRLRNARQLLRHLKAHGAAPAPAVAANQSTGGSGGGGDAHLGVAPYASLLRSSPFVLSPRGRGVDCYRHWEALLVGSVPVVQPSHMVTHMREAHGVPLLPLPRCDALLAASDAPRWATEQCAVEALNTSRRRHWRGIDPREHVALPPEAWWRTQLREIRRAKQEARCTAGGPLDAQYWRTFVRELGQKWDA